MDTTSSEEAKQEAPNAAVLTGPFLACLLVQISDILGQHFVQPVLVPYGLSLGAELKTIGLFNTCRFAFGVVSMLWMPLVADKCGRKFLLNFSILGSAVAYFCQGFAAMVGEPGTTQISIMFVGRGIAGFFGGTMPVLQATVTALSIQDGMDMVKTRLVLLQASNMAFGVALAPIAGALAAFGLNVPWVVASIMAVLIWFVTIFTFAEPPTVAGAAKGKGQGQGKGGGKGDGKGKAGGEGKVEAEVKSGNPFCDTKLLTALFARFLTMTCISGMQMALPTLLRLEDFGLVADTKVQTNKNVANANGLIGIPMGITQMLFSTVIFLRVANWLGESKCVLVGAAMSAIAFVLQGAVATAVWQAALFQGLFGMGVGLVIPAMNPLISKYAYVKYPSKTSQASSLPMIGMQLGLMFGPLIMSILLGDGKRSQIMLTFFTCAGLIIIGQCISSVVIIGINYELNKGKKEDLTPAEAHLLQKALETGAIPEEEFIDKMCDNLRQYLTAGSPKWRGYMAWHGIAQRHMQTMLENAFPQLPTVTNPREKQLDFQDPQTIAYMTAWISHVWPVLTYEDKERVCKQFGTRIPVPDYAWRDDPVAMGFLGASEAANMEITKIKQATELVERKPTQDKFDIESI